MKRSWLGRIDYQTGLSIQEETFSEVKAGSDCTLLGCEHNSVITLGVRGDTAQDIDQERIHDLNGKDRPEIVNIQRGGQATLHSPGQLVIYPIVKLRRLGFSVREFVHFLEDSTIQLLSHIGVSAKRCSEEPGLITKQGKIAAFGIRVQTGITSHGLAINATNDLQLFQLIRSCGVKDRPQDSIEAYRSNLNLQELFSLWCEYFESNLPSGSTEWRAPDTQGLEITDILPKD